MKNSIRFSVIFVLLVVGLASCKAYRNPSNLNPMYVIEQPQLGDKIPGLENLVIGDLIKVISLDSQVQFLIYDGVKDDNLTGYLTNRTGKKTNLSELIEVPISTVNILRVKRKSPAATIAYIGLWGALALGVTFGLIAVLTQTVN